MRRPAPSTTRESRDIASLIDPRLLPDMPPPHRSRRESLFTGIKSVLELAKKRKERKESEKCTRNLGLHNWDGFVWAEQRQEDGRRAGREWDSLNKQWKIVPNLMVERSVSPCDMSRITEESDRVQVGTTEEATSNDLIYEIPTSVGSQTDIISVRRSTLEHTDDSVATNHPNTQAPGADESDDDLCSETKRDSDTNVRFGFEKTDETMNFVHKSTPETVNDAKPSQPSLTATKKRFSLRRAAMWNAARISGRLGFDFWMFRGQGGKEANQKTSDGKEARSASSRRRRTRFEARTSKSKLNGLAKLLDSIDDAKVNTVRHIWREDRHEWNHVRDASTQTDMLIKDQEES